MKQIKINPKLSTCLRFAFLLLLLKSPQTLFAFSDMNDSTAQEEVVKSLQKRLDSLELRFEKSEIEKYESKKSIFDWNRGLFANFSSNVFDFTLSGTSASGYMFSRTKRNKTKVLLCPQFRLGTYYYSQEIREKHIRSPMDLFLSLGFERMKRVGDRVSYGDGWFVNVIPAYGQVTSLFGLIGGEYSNSLHFYYNESTSIGIGTYFRYTSILEDNTSWKSAIKNEQYNNLDFTAGLRLTISTFFARHESKSRSK